MSNALVVSGAYTASGHPVAVFGPQTGYFAPQLLMLQELQGPGISARGASFAGLSMYVELGRGQDYAWSATSAGQDVTDTYAVELCPTADADRLHLPLPRHLHRRWSSWSATNSWKPDHRRRHRGRFVHDAIAWRTKYGLVQYRATVGGKAVAYTRCARRTCTRPTRSSASRCSTTRTASTAGAFQQRACRTSTTPSTGSTSTPTHTAYYNCGANPVRAAGVDPNLPGLGAAGVRVAWLGPGDQHRRLHPASPRTRNSVDQDYYISWNNKQAKDYTAAGFGNGAVHRGDLLDDRVKTWSQPVASPGRR